MFSFQNSPVELGGFTAPGQEMNGISPGLGQETSEFSSIMNDFQRNGDLQQLTAKLAKLEKSGLPAEQMQMLQQLLADGKTLPEAAEAVFAALQEELAGLMEAGQLQYQDLEKIQKQMAVLAEILPDDIKEQLKPLLRDLELAIQQIKNLAKQDQDKAPELSSQIEKEDKKTTEPESSVLAGTVNPVVIDEVAKEINSNIKSAVNGHQNQKTNQVPNPITAVNVQDGKGFRGPVQFQENYGQLKDDNLQIDASKALADNKLMLNPANKLTSARINPAMINEQLSITSQQNTGTGGERSFGTMLNNGQNTSFTQLMSQSIPQPVTQNLHKPEWGGAVGDRITWMIGNKLQSAQLRITPAHLGPVEIKLRIENNVAQVSFVSNHQVVRDALEQAVPRLKEMLEEQNLDLVNVDIGKGNNSETGEQGKELKDSEQRSSATLIAKNDESEDQGSATGSTVITGSGVLDAYA